MRYFLILIVFTGFSCKKYEEDKYGLHLRTAERRLFRAGWYQNGAHYLDGSSTYFPFVVSDPYDYKKNGTFSCKSPNIFGRYGHWKLAQSKTYLELTNDSTGIIRSLKIVRLDYNRMVLHDDSISYSFKTKEGDR